LEIGKKSWLPTGRLVFVYDSSRSQVNLDNQGKFGRTSGENWLRKDLELSVKIEAVTLGSYVKSY
jgi:hypothetical protein